MIMEDQLVISGKFTHVRYRHDMSGFTVASFKLNDHQEKTITVTGILPSFDLNTLYECVGHYKEHERYGLQFEINEMHLQQPSDEQTLIEYFSSSRFSGIGKVSAKKIVDALGLDAIEKIEKDPHVLDDIFKKDEKRIQSIIKGIQESNQLDDSVYSLIRLD